MAIEQAAPTKAVWKGSVMFGPMVNIAVKMFLGVEEEKSMLRLLCAKHEAPVLAPRRCTVDDAVLLPHEVIKGVEVGPNQFVPVTDAELDELPVRTTKSIEIEKFIPAKQVPVLTHCRNLYFLEPEPIGRRAYAVLRTVLIKTKTYAVGRFAVRERENLGILFVQDNCIMLAVMAWPAAIRTTGRLNLPLEAPKKEEIALGVQMVEALRGSWEPIQYVDGYKVALTKLVQQKMVGVKATPPIKPAVAPAPDIMSALKDSLAAMRKKDAEKPKIKKTKKGKTAA